MSLSLSVSSAYRTSICHQTLHRHCNCILKNHITSLELRIFWHQPIETPNIAVTRFPSMFQLGYSHNVITISTSILIISNTILITSISILNNVYQGNDQLSDQSPLSTYARSHLVLMHTPSWSSSSFSSSPSSSFIIMMMIILLLAALIREKGNNWSKFYWRGEASRCHVWSLKCEADNHHLPREATCTSNNTSLPQTIPFITPLTIPLTILLYLNSLTFTSTRSTQCIWTCATQCQEYFTTFPLFVPE